MVAAAALVAVVLIGGAVALASRGKDRKITRAEANTSVSVSSAQATPAAPASTTATPDAPKVEITIKATPQEAHIFVDEQPIDTNPATLKRPRDGAIHVVRIESPGYDTREESFAFDRNLLVNLDLRPLPPTMELPNTKPQKATRETRTVRTSAPPPPPSPPPSPRPRSTGKPLDSENPYQ
jgi:serine/threonine-protein kinase